MNILLAEDDEDLRSILSQYLEINGFSILQAENGQAGLEIFKNEHVDVCILDIMMPLMDGFELARQIRKTDPDVPVIFLTAMAGASDIVQGFRVGGADYITKPFQGAELLARVRTHVRLHQLQQVLSVCSYCGKIRNDDAKWEPVETYIRQKTGADLSHGVCPDCYEDIRGQFPNRRDEY